MDVPLSVRINFQDKQASKQAVRRENWKLASLRSPGRLMRCGRSDPVKDGLELDHGEKAADSVFSIFAVFLPLMVRWLFGNSQHCQRTVLLATMLRLLDPSCCILSVSSIYIIVTVII